jgi:hypothetical protein
MHVYIHIYTQGMSYEYMHVYIHTCTEVDEYDSELADAKKHRIFYIYLYTHMFIHK